MPFPQRLYQHLHQINNNPPRIHTTAWMANRATVLQLPPVRWAGVLSNWPATVPAVQGDAVWVVDFHPFHHPQNKTRWRSKLAVPDILQNLLIVSA
jgi:hypothetical protein